MHPLVSDPNFNADDAPVDRERYPVPGLLMEVQPSRWVSIRETVAQEVEAGNMLCHAVDELMSEIGAQQHRFVTEAKGGASRSAAVKPPEPSDGKAVPPDALTVTQSDLTAALMETLSVFDQFSDMTAADYTKLISHVVRFIFE